MVNLIFDCDGTLVDSYDAITGRVQTAIRRVGVHCSAERIRELSLYQNVGYCMQTLAEENSLDLSELLKVYRGIPEELDLITPYQHALEVVSDPRFQCFVYTHRGPNCRYIFEKFGFMEHLAEVVDTSYGFRRKPDSQGIDYLVDKYQLDREQTYYVGDRLLDIECGQNAGVKTIFYNSSGLPIDASKADHVVNDLIEICSLPLTAGEKN